MVHNSNKPHVTRDSRMTFVAIGLKELRDIIAKMIAAKIDDICKSGNTLTD